MECQVDLSAITAGTRGVEELVGSLQEHHQRGRTGWAHEYCEFQRELSELGSQVKQVTEKLEADRK